MRPICLAVVIVLLAACAEAPLGDRPVTADHDAAEVDGADLAESPDVPPLHHGIDDLPEAVVHLIGEDETTVRVDVKVASTRAAARQGLMHVRELPDGIGMLFAYDEARTGGFWMKDTLIPLDIAFFDGDDVLRVILRMEPCSDDPCPVYDPGIAYVHALEVAAGWFDDQGVEPGWSLTVAEDPGSHP